MVFEIIFILYISLEGHGPVVTPVNETKNRVNHEMKAHGMW